MAGRKPSKMFVKYGILDTGEEFNMKFHNTGDTIKERGDDFYTEAELTSMENEKKEEEMERLKIVRCPLCKKFIEDMDDCRVCSDGHKFHKTCTNKYWKTLENGTRPNISMCFVTKTKSIWTDCDESHSGGKRRKRRYSKKNKKNHKKYFSKSKKRK